METQLISSRAAAMWNSSSIRISLSAFSPLSSPLINDAHLNKTLAYLTACTLYAALFDKSPQGLPIDTITDTRFFGDDRTKDRDGKPITQTFSKKDRADLQRIAWEGYREFQQLRGK